MEYKYQYRGTPCRVVGDLDGDDMFVCIAYVLGTDTRECITRAHKAEVINLGPVKGFVYAKRTIGPYGSADIALWTGGAGRNVNNVHWVYKSDYTIAQFEEAEKAGFKRVEIII